MGSHNGNTERAELQGARDRLALDLARGVSHLLQQMDFYSLTEFTVRSGRRVDVIGLNSKGELLVVEIKSSLEDFKSDRKWPEYQEYCDRFFFAVPDFFPRQILPQDTGLIIADPFSAAIFRESPKLTLNAARRRSLHLSFARTAARRLQGQQLSLP